jgi:hypothetical protein
VKWQRALTHVTPIFATLLSLWTHESTHMDSTKSSSAEGMCTNLHVRIVPDMRVLVNLIIAAFPICFEIRDFPESCFVCCSRRSTQSVYWGCENHSLLFVYCQHLFGYAIYMDFLGHWVLHFNLSPHIIFPASGF